MVLTKSFLTSRPVWLCAQCFGIYDTDEIELRLLDILQRKIMSYTLQDLRCTRCKQIKRENMAEFCSCAGPFETLISIEELNKLLKTFLQVAEDHNMLLLKENIEIFIQK